MVDGEKIYGKAVDWYAESAHSRSELIQKLSSLTRAKNVVKSVEQTYSEAAKANATESPLNGLWQWEVPGDSGSISGTIMLLEDAEGNLHGISYTETPFLPEARRRKGVKSMLNLNPIKGKVIANKNTSERTLSFTSKAANSARNQSQAKLVDGVLSGTTSVSGNYRNKDVAFSYKWTAKKVSF